MNDSLYHPCKICGGEVPDDISSHPVLAECVKYLSSKINSSLEEEEDEIEQTDKFISWKRHEEYLQLAEQEGYRKGLAQGQFQFENTEWNKAYKKGLDVGYLTAQRDIISKMKSVLDYDKDTED